MKIWDLSVGAAIWDSQQFVTDLHALWKPVPFESWWAWTFPSFLCQTMPQHSETFFLFWRTWCFCSSKDRTSVPSDGTVFHWHFNWKSPIWQHVPHTLKRSFCSKRRDFVSHFEMKPNIFIRGICALHTSSSVPVPSKSSSKERAEWDYKWPILDGTQ